MKTLSIKNIIVLLLGLILVPSSVIAQVTIPDVEFKNFLLTTYPSLFNSNQELDTIASATIGGVFDCRGNKKIESIEGIQYFKKLDEIKLSGDALLSLPNINRISKVRRIHLDTNNLTTLPDMSGLTGLLHLNLRENNLTSLTDLSAFTKLANLYLDNNELTTLPDLSKLANLRLFLIADNKLTSVPDLTNNTKIQVLLAENNQLTAFPSLTSCTALHRLTIHRNQITNFPDITGLVNLDDISAYSNKLQSIPDFSAYPLLTKLTVKNNNLTFEDILPSTNHPNFNSFTFFPQNKVGNATDITLREGDNFTIDLNIDNTINSNTYQWYKNGTLVSTTNTSKFTIDNINKNNEGTYNCIISNSNPKLAGKTIQSFDYKLGVAPCITANALSINVPSNNCQIPFPLVIDENSIDGNFKPFTYTLKNKLDTTEIITGNSNLDLKKEGSYELRIKNNNNCEVKTSIVVKRDEICEPIFYPNGDGIADTYYIELKGKAKIFTTEGDLIQELNTPAYWDGKTKKGHEVPSGLYVIVVNENTSIKLTLIR